MMLKNTNGLFGLIAMALASLGIFLAPGLSVVFQKMIPVKTQNSAFSLKAEANYGALPLSFEPNQGQTDPSVKFLCQGGGYNLFLTDQEAVLVLRHADKTRSKDSLKKLTMERPSFHEEVVRLKLKGAQTPSSVEGLEKLPGISNYFIGNDPSKWHTHIPQYARVKLKNIYPGIDVVYYGHQGRLEHDFIVAPGADPQSIRLVLEGVRKTRVDHDDNLVLMTKDFSIVLKNPVVYQMKNGQRQLVQAKYDLEGDQLAFAVSRYDSNEPLVIDPTLVYSTYVEGTATSNANAVAVDSAGDAYIGGYASVGFPTSAGAYQTGSGGGIDAMVAKLNPTGTTLIYATYLGGSTSDQAEDIAVDSAGDAYVVGLTAGNFPISPGAYSATYSGGIVGAFAAKLNPTGTGLIYSTYLGGTGDQDGHGIATDGLGNTYVCGWVFGSIPTTAGAYETAPLVGSQTGFILVFNPTGTSLLYGTYFGGTTSVEIPVIAVDSSNHIYVAGSTGTGFPTTAGAYQTAFSGSSDVFLSKLNPAGGGASDLLYSTYLGTSGTQYPYALALDSTNNVYLAGSTGGGFPTTGGAYQTTYGGGSSDAFVSKINPAGGGASDLLYSTYLGGSALDTAMGVGVDTTGNIWVSGNTAGGFPITPGAFQSVFAGGGDVFVAKLNPTGTGAGDLTYSTYLGGTLTNTANGMTVDNAGNAYVTGYSSGQFPTTSGAYQATNTSAAAFVSKFSSLTLPTSTPTNSPTVTATNSSTATATNTSTSTITNTPGLNTSTPTHTPTNTASSTATNTASNTASDTVTNTVTNTPTVTGTPTNTPTVTATLTQTATITPTLSPTATPTLTVTATPPCAVHVWPDPFNPNTAFDGQLNLGCIPAGATVSIYTISGELVISKQVTGGLFQWNGRNSGNVVVASGIYFYAIQSDNSAVNSGKFLMINGK
jgi:hypothetical protein